jgi:hypothetical protein
LFQDNAAPLFILKQVQDDDGSDLV